MVKHTQTIRLQFADKLSVFDLFVKLALKGLIFISTLFVLLMILQQSHHILIHEAFSVKIISFTFFFTFLNKTTFKYKTHIMTNTSRALLKPETIKKWKEK